MFHVTCFMQVIGNQKTVKLLERIVASGHLANAYLFLGPVGVGKLELASSFAKKIVHNTESIDSNLIVVAPEIEEKNGVTKKRDIKIEAVRELQHQLSLTSTGGNYKAVIIDEAERMNVTAQNALLKTLEEPNARVVLILMAQNERKLLPTIISRCQKIRLGLVTDDAIAKIIPGNIINKDEIIFWSAGRGEVAQSLLSDSQELDYRRELKADFIGLASSSAGERFALAEKWSKDTTDLPKKMDIWLVLLRQVLLDKIKINRVSPAKALQLMEAISISVGQIKGTNVNAKLVLENLFLKI